MKKLMLTVVCAGALMVSAFAQLLDEKNVTITMDLQPVLQISLQGPDQIDFTFDNINSYYAGITKHGANIIRLSASVSFDVWAAGLSMGVNGDFLWDQVISYQGGGATAIGDIPITALELRQYPPNPSTTAGNISGAACAATSGALSDYSSAYTVFDAATQDFTAVANNNIYTVANLTPYTAPTSTGAATTEKYIAGATGNAAGDGCQMVGGSYLMQSNAALVSPTSGAVGSLSGYYFVMDYRILPGLPAQFPCTDVTADTEGALNFAAGDANAFAAAGESNFDADDASAIEGAVNNYASPGVYTMFIKYIMVEDQ